MVIKPVPLIEWALAHPVPDQMYWKGDADNQIRFVWKSLAPLVGKGFSYEEVQQLITVIATHRSKSIDLPVYRLERSDLGLQIILRDNFYNWKISVISERPITADFSGLFYTTPPIDPDYTGDPLHHVYFEGFPKDLVFGYFEESDGKKWSAEIATNEILWTTVFLIMRSLGAVQPLKWRTKESHRAELEKDQ